MVKYGEELYTEKHASFGKNQGYKLNVTIDPDLASFLKGYYKSVHKVNGGESSHNRLYPNQIMLRMKELIWDYRLESYGQLVILAHRHLPKLVIFFAWGEKRAQGCIRMGDL